MYCGDETGAFVGELASTSCRFGYGGDDCPKSVLASHMHRDGTIPTTLLRPPSDGEDIIPIFTPTGWSPPSSSSTSSTSSTYSVDPGAYLQDGIVQNFDAWENAWHTAFQQLEVRHLHKHNTGTAYCKTAQGEGLEGATLIHPILSIDSGHTHLDSSDRGKLYQESMVRKQRHEMTEIIFEKLSAPAAFIAPAPMLTSFAMGRQTALVVDVGAGGTRVTPVVDGLLLQNAQRRNGRGGEWIKNVQRRVCEHVMKSGGGRDGGDGIAEVVPRYIVRGKGTDKKTIVKPSSLFHELAVRDVMYEMNTGSHVKGVALWRNDEYTDPFLKQDSSDDADKSNSSMDVDSSSKVESEDGECYVLPDGTHIDIEKSPMGKDLPRLAELLFAQDLPFSTNTNDDSSTSLPPTHSNLPIHELIKESLTAVTDADVRKELCGNIILSGASSLYPNLEQRLSLEVSHLVPSMYRCKIIASRSTIERRHASWIGGSILSSLGSFQQLWLGKAEYEEFGVVMGTQRFP